MTEQKSQNHLRQLLRLLMKPVVLFLFVGWVLWAFDMPKNWADVVTLDQLGLTPEESEWLKAHPTVTFAPDLNYAPIEFDDKGVVKGIAIDYLHWIEANYPIHFKIVKYNTWSEQIEAIKAKKIDMLSGAGKTPSRMLYMNFTDPYIYTPNVLLRNTSFPGILTEDDLNNKRIACVKDYAVGEFMQIRYPSIEIMAVQNIEEGLTLLNDGKIDLLVTEYYIATYYMSQMDLKHVAVETRYDLDFPQKLCMATRKDAPELASIMNKILLNMPPDVRHNIESQWIGNFALAHSAEVWIKYSVMALIVILAVSSIAFIWIYMLRHKVKEKTAELQSLNEKLEEKVERRTFLLSETNKQLEWSMYELQKREDEMERMNTELEASLETLTHSQKRLVEIEKVAALGNLVSTVAHELNTPIGNILTAFTYYHHEITAHLETFSGEPKILKPENNTQLHSDLFETTEQTRQIIMSSLERLNILIDRFKSMAVTTENAEIESFDLMQQLEDWLQLFAFNTKFTWNIACIDNEIPTDQCHITGYKKLFNEVFNNLIANSLIHGQTTDSDKPIQIQIMLEKKGSHFRIHFCDDGIGVPEGIIDRILEPLFSTKRLGGIGLSIVSNITHYAFEGTIHICGSGPTEKEQLQCGFCSLSGLYIMIDMPLQKIQLLV